MRARFARRTGLLVALALLCAPLVSRSQELLRVVDTPTAGMLDRGQVEFDLRLFPVGGVLAGVNVGLARQFLIGLSYGGVNVIGYGEVNWYPRPGVQARVRLIEENFVFPAVVLGFQSQGYGAFLDSRNRFETKSRGFFVAASRHYRAGFLLGLHGGLNYSLERDDGDNDLNAFVASTLDFGPQWSLLAEYDFAWNDNGPGALGRGNGVLNAGIRWQVGSRLSVDLVFKNLTHNRRGYDYSARILTLRYWDAL